MIEIKYSMPLKKYLNKLIKYCYCHLFKIKTHKIMEINRKKTYHLKSHQSIKIRPLQIRETLFYRKVMGCKDLRKMAASKIKRVKIQGRVQVVLDHLLLRDKIQLYDQEVVSLERLPLQTSTILRQ